jgi:hypothetical protein
MTRKNETTLITLDKLLDAQEQLKRNQNTIINRQALLIEKLLRENKARTQQIEELAQEVQRLNAIIKRRQPTTNSSLFSAQPSKKPVISSTVTHPRKWR